VSFIDDHNKFVWIYLLRYKSQVFEKFNEFQQLVERRFNRKIVAIQTDWGGEYEKLNYFFRKVGISHLVSCPHAHQQNGAAEHKHRHIVEVGLSLLAHSSIPLKYWDEAFLAATYLINRTPAKSLQFSSPHEVLFQEKPEYSMLRVFGCACWPNLRPYNTHKLAFRSKRCVFLGYNNMHKGFKCLDISTSRIYISRDVIFDEQIFPFAELHANAGARLRSDIELLPSNLYDSSLPFGSTTISSTDVINSTSNPPDNSHPNLEANAQEEPILHAAPQGETGAHRETDSPAPAAPGSASNSSPCGASSLGPAAQPSGATHTPEESPGAEHVRATDTAATCHTDTGSGLADQSAAAAIPPTAVVPHPSPGSGVPGGSLVVLPALLLLIRNLHDLVHVHSQVSTS
jgi:histone deacetylase 1/2